MTEVSENRPPTVITGGHKTQKRRLYFSGVKKIKKGRGQSRLPLIEGWGIGGWSPPLFLHQKSPPPLQKRARIKTFFPESHAIGRKISGSLNAACKKRAEKHEFPYKRRQRRKIWKFVRRRGSWFFPGLQTIGSKVFTLPEKKNKKVSWWWLFLCIFSGRDKTETAHGFLFYFRKMPNSPFFFLLLGPNLPPKKPPKRASGPANIYSLL